MPATLSKEEIKIYEKLKFLSEAAPIREKIKFFEKKYGCNFEEFEKKLDKGKEEFEKWDDYIEWKAYIKSLRELENKLKELEK